MHKTTPAGTYSAKENYRDRKHFTPQYAMARAPLSIYKTENSYEVLVFAPGREKENFKVELHNRELVIRYNPTTDTSGIQWIRKEYSRGGFTRSLILDETVETENIRATYEQGVLQISLTIQPGAASVKQDIAVN